MTQEELGARVGVGRAQISKVESGKVAGFVVACVSEFARAYSLTIATYTNYSQFISILPLQLLHLRN
ncbi:MAG: helix-turn-helix transcriptional regulator [Rikenellaceae bacterium]